MRMYDLDSMSLYGFGPAQDTPSPGVARPTEHMAIAATDLASGWKALVDPRNPLFWFGGLLLVTFGAAGVSGSARVGKVSVSGSAGTT